MSSQNSEDAVTKANLLGRIEQGWNELQAYLATLSEAQLTQPTDAAGWTAKDHVIHMAMWEAGIAAILEGKSRPAAMGIDEATWALDTDEVNAAIQKQNQHLTVEEVTRTFRLVHERLLNAINALTDEDLMRPYTHFDSTIAHNDPIVWYIVGNSYGHYEEHRPWMEAIVGGQ